jgi:hypothetical protein
MFLKSQGTGPDGSLIPIFFSKNWNWQSFDSEAFKEPESAVL